MQGCENSLVNLQLFCDSRIWVKPGKVYGSFNKILTCWKTLRSMKTLAEQIEKFHCEEFIKCSKLLEVSIMTEKFFNLLNFKRYSKRLLTFSRYLKGRKKNFNRQIIYRVKNVLKFFSSCWVNFIISLNLEASKRLKLKEKLKALKKATW